MFSRAYVPWPVRALSYFAFAAVGKSLVWPGNVCKRCAPQLWFYAMTLVLLCAGVAMFFFT
jgi:hypothetical protein